LPRLVRLVEVRKLIDDVFQFEQRLFGGGSAGQVRLDEGRVPGAPVYGL
jgi:hypothetical protein